MNSIAKDQIQIRADKSENDAQIENLMKLAFGPGRFTKAAHFLRLGNETEHTLSRIAFYDGKLIGACRIWPIISENGTKAHFLGPILISPDFRNLGLGQLLVSSCIDAIERENDKGILLVGDVEFFGKFGFEPIPMGQIKLPLPALNGRILGLNIDYSKFSGEISSPQKTK